MDLTKIPFIKAQHYKPGRINTIKIIVLHCMEAPQSEGRAKVCAESFASPESRVASAHFSVDDKAIYQSVKVEDTAYHCINGNSIGIGIEHAGMAEFTSDQWNSDYSKAMFELSAQLSAQLCKDHDIPIQHAQFKATSDPTVIEKGFALHSEVPLHGAHWDPGPNFPFDYYLQRVQFYFDQLENGDAK